MINRAHLATRFVIVCLLSCAPLGPAQAHRHLMGVNYPAGTGPVSIAVGDFNGDGVPDMAVANSNLFGNGTSSVSILIGNGDGTFQPAVNYQAGTTPRSVAVGDFNGDGHLDLAVANQDSNSVSILLGNGDGTFGPAKSGFAGIGPFFVVVGDFNGDHKLDLAVANFAEQLESGRLSVLLGKGDGSFGRPTQFDLGHAVRTHMMVATDVNGDGVLDLIVASAGVLNNPGKISVLLGTGKGGFSSRTDFAAGQNPFSVAVADLNGDGHLDLAVADETTNEVSVLLGDGHGSFGTPASYAAGALPFSVAIGGFNGDGKLDLVTANENSNDVTILRGNGDGTFGKPISLPADQAPQFVAVADFNGDGVPDLAVANLISNDVTVLLGSKHK